MKHKKPQQVAPASNPFKEAVEATTEIKDCFKPGLQALGANSAKIDPANTRDCNGSVFIDSCVDKLYPEDSRWDYMLSYNSKVYFVEVHPAQTSEVKEVIKKLNWLKAWLAKQAPDIEKMKVTDQTPYYWISTSGVSIPVGSPQHRMATTAGILPSSKLKLK